MNFEQTLRLGGLLPRSIVADGKIRRCPTEANAITPENVRELFVYDPGSGEMHWRVNVSKNIRAGAKAGCLGATGGKRLRIGFKKRTYFVHRVAFLYVAGRWPTGEIDHINGDSTDDRFINLREATAMQNAWNHKGRTKKSGLPMGVRQLKSGRFVARIACEKKKFSFGPFDSVSDAHAVYQQKRKEFFGAYS